jgi:hypothetical protein
MDTTTIYVERNDGLYNAYMSNNDKYIVGPTRQIHLEPHIATALCEVTSEYNKMQDLLYELYND